MNKQPIEKKVEHVGVTLDVHSIFYTIQGEGPFAGTPAVFLRLAGCNLQCPGCDTEYTQGRQIRGIYDILDTILTLHTSAKERSGLVVITGGEPFRQNLSMLCRLLLSNGFFIQIETNGTLKPSFEEDNRTPLMYSQDIGKRSGVYVVCSPKTPKINELTAHLACCFKYVMSHDSVGEDGLPLVVLGNGKRTVWRPNWKENKPIYLQPADHTEELLRTVLASSIFEQEKVTEANLQSLEAVKTSCLKHGYILQLQIHKLIGVE